jgi:hypothetical protein
MVKWERHGEFTRYSITQALPFHAESGAENLDIATGLAISVIVAAVAYFTSKIRHKLHQK